MRVSRDSPWWRTSAIVAAAVVSVYALAWIVVRLAANDLGRDDQLAGAIGLVVAIATVAVALTALAHQIRLGRAAWSGAADGARPPTRRHWLVTGSAGGLILVVAVIPLLTTGSDPGAGNAHAGSDQALVPTDPTGFQVRAVLRNPTGTGQTATDVSVSIASDLGQVCAEQADHDFALSDEIRLGSHSETAQASDARVSEDLTLLSGRSSQPARTVPDPRSRPAKGTLASGCSRWELRLSFDVPVILPPHQVTTVAVNIPSRLTGVQTALNGRPTQPGTAVELRVPGFDFAEVRFTAKIDTSAEPVALCRRFSPTSGPCQ